MNKYQKANELIHLKEEQKNAMIDRIMAADAEPVRRPFPWKYWLSGFAAAALVLVFVSAGLYRKTADEAAAAAPMAEAAETAQVTAEGASFAEDAAPALYAGSERMQESADEEAAVNSLNAAVPQDSCEKAGGTVSYRVISDPKETEGSLSSWGEKHTVVIEETEVAVYGNQAAEFTAKGRLIQVIFDQPVSEEALKQAVGEVIRG